MLREVSPSVREWNHNTHHHAALLRLLPPRPESVVDVGCGDGSFAALLGRRCDTVLALDVDLVQVEVARRRCAAQPNVTVQAGDFLGAGLPSDRFDVVTALASFHQMPFDVAAKEVVRVLKPGGRLIMLGVWTDRSTAWDIVLNLISTALNLVLRRLRGPDVMAAPATMPTMTFRQVERSARHHFPGARIKRHALWRYTLTWVRPPS
jgi:ubiquinone/menaquinone biosynthesis C-methylase UbiE